MKKTFNVQTKEPTAHFMCQHISQEAGLAFVVQGTLITTKGKQTDVEVDFFAKTVQPKNRLFKVEWLEFTEVPYVE